jgi:hypothetical protein
MDKKPISHMVVGLIISLIMIILFLGFYYTGNSFNKGPLSYLPLVVFGGGLIFSIVQFSKANNHNVTFGSCFSYGFKATAIIAIIMAVFVFCFITFVPEYKDQFMDFMRSEMEKNSQGLSEDQMDKSVGMIGKFFTISAVGGGLFMNLLIGAIASLIGAAVAKKNPANPFDKAGNTI